MKRVMSVGLGLLISASVSANTVSFEEYVAGLRAQAKEEGISQQTIDAALSDVKYRKKAVVADKNQPEKRLTLDEYIPRAVPQWKIDQAQKKFDQYRSQLASVAKEYGVSPRFIVALWGVESNFGRLTGKYKVVDALATLAYDGRREAFFRSETLAALKIIDQGHISADKMLGSWAGAMGQCQFMPSSFIAYGADGNQDGHIDIWQTEADVFASAANYLAKSGWQKEYTWGREIKLPKGFDWTLAGREKDKGKPLSEWRKLGLTKADGQPLPAPSEDITAWVVAPDNEKGRIYLIYNNYNVLMKWNRSYYFATAVSYLADHIKY